MNPLTKYLWLGAALLLAAVLSFTHLTAYRKGKANVKAEWVSSVAAANTEALRLERARQSAVDSAGKLAAARQGRLAVDAAGSTDAMQRLRDQLSARRVVEESLAAANQRAATAEQLFLESAEALRGLAATCDRHTSDVKLLLDAWPQ